jgi:diaminopimelate decarboxylase
LCFNVESEGELLRLNEVAGKIGKKAPFSLRINPDVDPKTHPYIATGLKENKFGVDYADALALYRKAKSLPHIEVTGIDCHIGSQLTEIAPFIDSLERILALLDKLEKAGIAISHIDIGGGLGIRYRDETPPNIAEYAAALFAKLGKRRQKILIEPGRAMVGHAGVLLTRVEYLKHNRGNNFAIVDAAMNDLQRPALYGAYHEILPVSQSSRPRRTYEIAGPVCESADFIGRGRKLGLAEGDLLAVMSTGAYGMSMSSNYNTRPRAAEVMVDDDKSTLIRRRETTDQLFSGETLLS